jgi:hypothetical protein
LRRQEPADKKTPSTLGGSERYARGARNQAGETLVIRAEEVHVAVTFQRNAGMLLLAIWLILYGLSGMVALGLPSPLMAVLALIAGVLILAGR